MRPIGAEAQVLPLFLLLLITAACGPRWTPVSSQEGQFRVDLIEPFRASDTFEHRVSEGVLTFHGLCATEGAEGHYALPFTRPPILLAQSADISSIERDRQPSVLEQTIAAYRDGMVKNHHARLVTERNFTSSSCTGTEIEFALEHTTERARFCIAIDRLYFLQITGRADQVAGSYGRRFFESFRVVG